MAGELKYRLGQRVFVGTGTSRFTGYEGPATIIECRPEHPTNYVYVVEFDGQSRRLPILEREIITDLPMGDTLDDLEAWLAS